RPRHALFGSRGEVDGAIEFGRKGSLVPFGAALAKSLGVSFSSGIAPVGRGLGVGRRTGRGAPRNSVGTISGTSACASAGTRRRAGAPSRAEPASRRRMMFLYQVRDRSATVARPGLAPPTLTERTSRIPAWRSVVGLPSPTLTRLPAADLRFAGGVRRVTR